MKLSSIIGKFVCMIVLAVLVVIPLLPIQTVLAAGTNVGISPTAQSVSNGANFTVNISIDTSTAFLGWQADVAFDPSKMECTAVTEGAFLKSWVLAHGGFMYSAGAPIIDNTNGQILNINSAGLNASSGPTGTGILYTLSFSAKSNVNSISQLSLTNVVVTDTVGNTINGTTVTSGYVAVGTISPPSITSFTPDSGITGTAITINGSYFTGASAVSFGGVPASGFTINSDSQITASVGAGSSGAVSVTAPGGTANSAGFVYISSPVINSFLPVSAGAGSPVIISGSGLSDASAVSFGGIPAQSFLVNSDTQITAVVGSGASGEIHVTNSGGTGIKAGFIFISRPVITSFTPVYVGTGGSVILSGSDFLNATAVSFGGTPAQSFTVNSATQITAVVGAGASGSVGVVTAGGSATFPGFVFISPPTISAFSPSSATLGSVVVITGNHLTGTTSVSFGTTPSQSFIVDSDTQITATVGEGSSGLVSVTTPGGAASSPGFNYFLVPTISSFTPTTATTGNTLVISGSNFSGTTSVSIGGVSASSFLVDSSSQITVTIGSGASGEIRVVTPGGTAILPGFNFIAPSAALTIHPNDQILANGSNFTVDLVINTSNGFLSWQSDIHFNPQVLQCTGVTEGNFLKIYALTNGGFTVPGSIPVIDNTLGKVSNISYIALGTNTGGRTGTGTLCSLNFTASSPGNMSSSLTPVNTQIYDANGNAMPNLLISSGNVNVVWPQPQISSFTPTLGYPGTQVTITGINFTGTSSVTVGGVAAQGFTVDSDTQITAVVGLGASGFISLTAPGGTTSSADLFYLVPVWDVNRDHVVNILDVIRVGLHWQETGSAGWIAEDVNRDGIVNILDVIIIGLHWQETW